MSNAARIWGVLAVMGLMTVGCATNRGELDIRPPVIANPAGGQAVKLVQVSDSRIFEMSPRDPSIPSLMDGAIQDKALTARAIARKRNGFGKALGDILLPEGRTATDLVTETATRAFREAGYRVVESGGPGAEGALPIEIRIDELWAWFTPGAMTITTECRLRATLSGPLAPFQAGREIMGESRTRGMASTSKTWLETVQKGLDDFGRQVRECLVAGR